ncbi:MAG TPA: SigE family RNA polymerase sigma factor [Mycobacteriales bacterium]
MRGDTRSDADEFDAFVARSGLALARLAWVVAGGRAAGEDLLQNTLIRVWRHWPRVRDAEDPDRYVRRILVNVHRSAPLGRRRELPLPDRDRAGDGDATDAVDARLTIEDALRRLPARQRAVVALRFLEQRSERETAELMGCSVGTVKSHSARALAALRRSPSLVELVSGEVRDD